MVFGSTALRTPRGDGGDVSLEPLLLCAICLRRELHECVQRDLHPGALGLREVVEIGENAADDGLVGDDDDVLASLELHDYWFEADDDVTVGFAASVAV